MTSLWVTRTVLVSLSAVLAVVLIARGNVVIGVLVGALALTRLVHLIQIHRRRERMHSRRLGTRAARRSERPLR